MPPRDALLRLNDWYEVYGGADPSAARAEGGRCINCGVAFCMPDSGYGPDTGCPIANKIPEWNELVEQGRWADAYRRLSETNPFPEFTSRICPAPCQGACILGINEHPIQIKGVERAIIDHAFAQGWVTPPQPDTDAVSGGRVGIVGSGPAGLAAADWLIRRGHEVTVYERSDLAGGLLTYGVPNMKLDKSVVQRRVDLLARGGVRFVLNAEVGRTVTADQLLDEHDAVLIAVGAQRARRLDLPGANLMGVHLAMDYLNAATERHLGVSRVSPAHLDAANKDVVVIGGGDTGADCVATALRQGCRSMINITRREKPGDHRDGDHPWPGPPGVYDLDYAHLEGRARFGRDPREYAVEPLEIIADDSDVSCVARLRIRHLDSGVQDSLPAQLVLLAIGFTGHDASPLARAFGIEATGGRFGNSGHRTSVPRVYAAGDCRRGSSLIVWAIREGLDAARAIHHDLTAVPKAKPS